LENAKVLALKYRPRKFSDVIGQESVSKTLSLALQNSRLAHAYLFSGIRGSGKTSSARIFSKSLNCDKGPTPNPCEECENCVMANESRHIDIIEMDAASSRKIDDIRELIEHTRYKPTIGRYKIFIIDEVHMLTKEAFNALLKTLEEPPEYVKFILATTDPLKLPPTILSRTQHFRFKKIGKKETSKHLEFILDKEGIEYEKEALDILTRSGGGSLRDTLTLLEQAIVHSDSNITAKSVSDMLGLVDPERFFKIMDAVFLKDIDALKAFAIELDESDAEMAVEEMIEFLSERMYERDIRYSPMLLDRFFRILSETKGLLSLNIGSFFALMLMFYKMVEALKVKEIDEMIESLEGETKNIKPQAPIAKKPEIELPTQAEEVAAEPQKIEVKDSGAELFSTLIAKIYDRSYELGEIFKEYIEYDSYEDGTLRWSSYADEETSKTLRNNWIPIKHLVGEVFGVETKIDLAKKEPKKKSEKVEEKPTKEFDESGSTTMDIVQGSCSTPQLNEQRELSSEEIRSHPLFQKVTELFDAKRDGIKVYNKV
jgi:DNA polymerase-3 subunit gamma/tau